MSLSALLESNAYLGMRHGYICLECHPVYVCKYVQMRVCCTCVSYNVEGDKREKERERERE